MSVWCQHGLLRLTALARLIADSLIHTVLVKEASVLLKFPVCLDPTRFRCGVDE
jgi:hypothetical protein